MAHTVFICHSAQDKHVADAACAVLESHRIPCWIAPRDILGGDEWGEAIVSAINECHILLVIFSGHANTSAQVRREIERGISKGKIILPFRIEDVEPTGAMEYALGNTHWLDALTPPMEANLNQLAETANRILQRGTPAQEKVHAQPVPAGPTAPQPTNSTQAGSPPRVTAAVDSPKQRRRKPILTLAILVVITLAVAGFFLWHHFAAKPITTASDFRQGDALFKANNFEDARPFIERACSGGSLSACGDLGVMFASGKGEVKDMDKAVQLYRKACDGGYAESCSKLGDLYSNGMGVVQSYGQAAASYRKACDGGYYPGCSYLGTLYYKGQGVAKDDNQSAVLLRKACDNGFAVGCNNLGVLYDKGQGVPHDDSQASVFYSKACNAGVNQGCFHLGTLYDTGQGVTQDHNQAAILYRKACDGGDLNGCNGLKKLQH